MILQTQPSDYKFFTLKNVININITFVINTKKGVAEYPSVSLSAVPLKDRRRIQESLNNIMET